MLGRKIVQHRLMEEPQPPAVSKVAANMLTINTETAVNWNRPLQERTNTSTITPRTATLSRTPDTSNTFGVRNPTPHSTFLSPPSPDIKKNKLRRLTRYSTAEQALAETLKTCNSEASPRELQIRALEQATLLLSAHAQDARDRAAELRIFLANREADEGTYMALQRECWMEEKRQAAVDHESKVVHQHLVSLSRSSNDDTAQCGLNGIVKDPDAKRRANLVRFLEISAKRTSISSPKAFPLYLDRSPRRMTMGNVSPMRLRSSPITPNFAPLVNSHLRGLSLDGRRSKDNLDHSQHHLLSPSEMQTSIAGTPGITRKVPLAIVTEDQDEAYLVPSSPLSPMPTIAPVSHTRFSATETSQCSTLSSPTSSDSPSKDHWQPLDGEGVATIYRSAVQLRSKADIIAGLCVALPEYARDLFNDFDDASPFHLDMDRTPRHAGPSSAESPSDWDIVPSRVSPPPTLRYSTGTNPHVPWNHRGSFLSLGDSPPSTPSRPRATLKKPPPLARKQSQRQLGSLFSIPEAISSRIGVAGDRESKTLSRKPSKSFFSRSRTELKGSSVSISDTSVNDQPEPQTPSRGDVNLMSKIKRRFSAQK